MTLTLDIPPDLERRLNHEAEKLGLRAQEYTLRLLSQHLPAKDRSARAVDLLQSWIDDEEDEEEQKDTGRYLIRVLDEDRMADRKLFPADLQGVTW